MFHCSKRLKLYEIESYRVELELLPWSFTGQLSFTKAHRISLNLSIMQHALRWHGRPELCDQCSKGKHYASFGFSPFRFVLAVRLHENSVCEVPKCKYLKMQHFEYTCRKVTANCQVSLCMRMFYFFRKSHGLCTSGLWAECTEHVICHYFTGSGIMKLPTTEV